MKYILILESNIDYDVQRLTLSITSNIDYDQLYTVRRYNPDTLSITSNIYCGAESSHYVRYFYYIWGKGCCVYSGIKI